MPMRTGTPLPSMDGAVEWLNGKPDLEKLAGKPLLVHFWSATCHICHDNMPTVRQWVQHYGPSGLGIVAIHMPREEFETDVERVRTAAAELGITEPCGIDNLHAVVDAFENPNRFVPAYYLFDREGKLRSRAAGDAGLALLESALKRQFNE